MRNFTIIAVLLISISCFSQTPSFTWGKNAGVHFNQQQYSTADNEGNVYLLGSFIEQTITIFGTTLTNTSNSGFTDMYLFKFDSLGNVLYAKVIGGPKNDASGTITTDSANNFYICTGINEILTIDTTVLTSDQGGTCILKFNSDGNLQWATPLTSPGSPCGVAEMSIDSSENIYIAGSYYGWAPTMLGSISLEYPNYNPDESGSARSYVAKLDNQGNCLWAKAGVCNEPTVFTNQGLCVAVDAEGSVYSGGMFYSMALTFDNITLTKSLQATGNGNMFVVKYDTNGNALWARNAGSQYLNSTSTRAISTAGNQVYVSGYFTSSAVFGTTTLTANSGSNIFTVKYGADGTVLWAKKPTNSGGFNGVQSSDTDNAGNLYIAGTFYDNSLNFGNGVILTNSGQGAAYVVKYNPDGMALWGQKAGQLNVNNVIAIACSSENELSLSGTFTDPILTCGSVTLNKTVGTNYDAFIAKLYYEPLGTNNFSAERLAVHPNPVDNKLYVDNLKENASYAIYDMAGKGILSGMLVIENAVIETDTLAPGLYLLSVSGKDGTVSNKKIMVE